MKTSRTSIIAFTAGALATGSLAFLIAAGPEHDEHKGMDHAMDAMDQPGMGEEGEIDMMAEMMRLATPDKHHEALGIMVGNWKAHTSFIMDPSQPPMEGEGTMSAEWVLGGRYIHTSFKMDFMGEPFEGIGYLGYDIAHEEYNSIWMDSMSTKISLFTGGEEEGDALVMKGIATTPMGDNPMKIETSFPDENTMVDKMYDQMPDGSWFNSGTITYTRQ